MSLGPWTWTPDDAPSDLSVGGAAFNRRMLHYPEDVGVYGLTVGADVDGFFFSPVGQPGSVEWPGGTWEVRVRVVTPNTRVDLDVVLERVGEDGTFKAVYGGTSPQNLGTAGVLSFVGTASAQSGVSVGDRLRVRFVFIRQLVPGSGFVELGYGDPATDLVTVPILMANSRITYNGVNVDFPGLLSAYHENPRFDRSTGVSAGGVSASVVHGVLFDLSVELQRFVDALFEARLWAWWSWAGRGKSFAFALDSADVVDKTLTGAAAAGQKDLPFTDTSGFVVGNRYLVREVAGNEFEVFEVASVTAGVKVTAVDNLVYGYATGDVVRSRGYLPKVTCVDVDFPVSRSFTTWTLRTRFREDKG